MRYPKIHHQLRLWSFSSIGLSAKNLRARCSITRRTSSHPREW